MIIPLGINHVIRGWPRVTIAIITACVALQLASMFIGPSEADIQSYAQTHALELAQSLEQTDDGAKVPDLDAIVDRMIDDVYDYADGNPTFRLGYRPKQGLSSRLLTYAFAHGGWLHLIGNMIFLWLAGAALEDRWGRARFVAFYAAGAVVSALGYVALGANPQIILIGASGAVAALMGAFLILFAKTEIHLWYFFLLRWGRFDVRAYVALPLWLLGQFFSAHGNTVGEESGGVAYTAHIIGFLFGAIVAIASLALARKSAQPAAASSKNAMAEAAPHRAAAPQARPTSQPSMTPVIATAPTVSPSTTAAAAPHPVIATVPASAIRDSQPSMRPTASTAEPSDSPEDAGADRPKFLS